ncbi:unnamed protein product [Prorocentrum cordatum]|uniref:Poly [ADP-ribose] polymerase n=1 Tax=Prorocentrum cordatum TaxID=2364126 RepID=A0ABN9UN13_9DINO|nr:unnamed protein product [Polarella glacialis]
MAPPPDALRAALAAAASAPKAELLCRPRPPGSDAAAVRLGLAELAGAAAAESPAAPPAEPAGAARGVGALLDQWRAGWVPAGPQLPGLRGLDWEAVAGRAPDVVLSRPPREGEAADGRGGGGGTIWGYHGAPFENVWSLLGFGFVSAALPGQSLGRTGEDRQLFGQGVYLSQEPALAYSYARKSGWLPHGLGRWRCLLVAEVAMGPLVKLGGAGPSSGLGAGTAPEGYISECCLKASLAQEVPSLLLRLGAPVGPSMGLVRESHRGPLGHPRGHLGARGRSVNTRASSRRARMP